jgi:hypothetical protein
LTFTELNVLVLVVHDERAARRPAPLGWELRSLPYRSER